MRIALFTDTYLPDINGVVSSIELLRQKLEEKGHDVYVICPYSGLFKILKEGKIIRLPGIELKSLYGYKAASPAHFLFLEELSSYHFDIFHVHTEFGIGIFAGIAAKHLQVPLIRTYHTTYEDYTHYINFANSASIEMMAKKIVSFLSKQYGNGCMRLISPSEKTAEMLKKYGIKTPIEIIPTGIELKRFSNGVKDKRYFQDIYQECGIEDGKKMFLYVGRIAEEKSILMLLETVALLKNQRQDFKLVVVGGGPQEKELTSYVKENNLEDYVVFVGKKPFELVPRYYHAADAFMSASTTETQGMTYVEALASGLPVFARYDEVLTGLVVEGNNGFYFHNAEELSSKLIDFFNLSLERIEQIKKDAIVSAKRYDSETFVSKIIHLYQEAMEEYSSSYEIEKITVKNDYVNISLLSSNKEKENLLISVDDFYDEGLRKGDKIDKNRLQKISEKENKAKAYRLCLKRIAGKDYTIKQMYDFLIQRTDLPIQDINDIIEKLIDRSLLDDKKYTLLKLSSLESSFLSQRKIINKLRKDGVPVEIIEECLSRNDDKESSNAKKMALKYQNNIRNKSLIVKKQTILQRLFRDGFDSNVCLRAVEELDFTKEEFTEKDTLEKEAIRLRKRLQRKYSGTMLRNRMYNSLASKGFRSEIIFAVLNEMEWTENE